MKTKLQIRLFNANLASPTFIENLESRVENLRFSTQLHGGFGVCTFRLKTDMAHGWEWLTKRYFYRIVIADDAKTLWEGRIQEPAIDLYNGAVDITAYGYYASLNDQRYNTAYNANADVVIKAILTAACPQISSDQTHIGATGGPAITSGAGEEYLDKSPRELVERLADFGDSGGDKWYFAIWEERVPYFTERSLSAINWQVKLSDLAPGSRLKHSTIDLWNKVYAVYTAAGVVTRTADAQDTISQTKYGVTRYYCVPNLGEVAVAAADAARDKWLEEHKDIYPSAASIVLGAKVFNANGVAYPSSWVRAGQVLRIVDLIPATADLDSITRNALNTFYITGTDYDLESGTNRLTIDTESQVLSAILARKLR